MTTPRASTTGAFALIVSGTVLGLAGTDLVLPAIPGLPRVLGGGPAEAQLVLASFTAGAAAGLLLFGALGARFDQRPLLLLSLLAYGVASALCSVSPDIGTLVALRFFQGVAGSAPAVFAPGMIRGLYGDDRAVGAIGLLGSIESLAPALAPVAGLWLLQAFGWRASFHAIAALALLLSVLLVLQWKRIPLLQRRREGSGYLPLLRNAAYLRYAVSHAFTLGALLVFVFGAPAVLTGAMGGSLSDFIVMQVSGIALFIVASNITGTLVRRQGAEPVIVAGTAVSALGGMAMLGYALAGGGSVVVVTAIFPLLCIGLGLRGPPGFHQAILAARDDDARGSALLVMAILLTAAAGTALVAPFIAQGLPPLAFATAALAVLSLLWTIALQDRRRIARE